MGSAGALRRRIAAETKLVRRPTGSGFESRADTSLRHAASVLTNVFCARSLHPEKVSFLKFEPLIVSSDKWIGVQL